MGERRGSEREVSATVGRRGVTLFSYVKPSVLSKGRVKMDPCSVTEL